MQKNKTKNNAYSPMRGVSLDSPGGDVVAPLNAVKFVVVIGLVETTPG